MKKIIFSLLIVGVMATQVNAMHVLDVSLCGKKSDESGRDSSDVDSRAIVGKSITIDEAAVNESVAKWRLFNLCCMPEAFECSAGWFGKRKRERKVEELLAEVRLLLKTYPQLYHACDAVSGRKRTLFHAAVAAGNIRLVRLFIREFLAIGDRSGFNPNQRDMDGRAPLHDAVLLENPTLVTLLLGVKNINVNVQSDLLATPLHCALHLHNSERKWSIVRRLLATGKIDPNVCDDQGGTVVHIVATQIVELGCNQLKKDLLLSQSYEDSKNLDNLFWVASLLLKKWGREVAVEIRNNNASAYRVRRVCLKNGSVIQILIPRGQTANDIIESSRLLHVIDRWRRLDPRFVEQVERENFRQKLELLAKEVREGRVRLLHEASPQEASASL